MEFDGILVRHLLSRFRRDGHFAAELGGLQYRRHHDNPSGEMPERYSGTTALHARGRYQGVFERFNNTNLHRPASIGPK